jgi:hypothetical protein
LTGMDGMFVKYVMRMYYGLWFLVVGDD